MNRRDFIKLAGLAGLAGVSEQIPVGVTALPSAVTSKVWQAGERITDIYWTTGLETNEAVVVCVLTCGNLLHYTMFNSSGASVHSFPLGHELVIRDSLEVRCSSSEHARALRGCFYVSDDAGNRAAIVYDEGQFQRFKI